MNSECRYQIRNGPDYNESLINRGSINLWFTEDALQNWYNSGQNKGTSLSPLYSDACIECALHIKAYFQLLLRATQVFLISIVSLLELDLEVP